MSHLRVLICRVDDENHPEQMTELQRIDLPAVDPQQLTPETALDTLEAQSLTTGQEVMRCLLGQQWQEVDRQLTAEAKRLSPPWEASLVMASPASRSPARWASSPCPGKCSLTGSGACMSCRPTGCCHPTAGC